MYSAADSSGLEGMQVPVTSVTKRRPSSSKFPAPASPQAVDLES